MGLISKMTAILFAQTLFSTHTQLIRYFTDALTVP